MIQRSPFWSFWPLSITAGAGMNNLKEGKRTGGTKSGNMTVSVQVGTETWDRNVVGMLLIAFKKICSAGKKERNESIKEIESIMIKHVL